MGSSRTLILNIDRDDDIGFKASIESPVIGREACLDAAITLALADPEDSDVNAIFQAIATYDKLKKDGEEVFIAVLGGNHFRFIEGDRKIARMIDTLVHDLGVDSCILVTDGGEDEYILPIIQNKLPISSIQRVVVSQMPNLEGTYYIIKKLINDPKISKIVLVLPGLTLLLYAICYGINRPEIATMIIAAAIGGYLLYKGFSLDEFLKSEFSELKTTLYRGRFSFVTYIGGIIFAIIGIMEGTSILSTYWDGTGLIPMALVFFWGSVLWFTLAAIITSLGPVIDSFIYDRDSLSRAVISSYFISSIGVLAFGGMSYVLSNSGIRNFPVTADMGITYIIQGAVGGLVCALVGIILQRMVYRWARDIRIPGRTVLDRVL
jgi:putative membrane protein